MKNNLRTAFLLIPFTALAFSCSSSHNLSGFFKDRHNLIGKNVEVSGVLYEKERMYFLCETHNPDNCVNLELKSSFINRLQTFVGKQVLINGIYLDHDYVENDDSLQFVPSRVSVTSVIEVNDKK